MKIKPFIYKIFHTPIGKNIIANFFKVFVIFLNQILLVPLYILYWGNELYSDWIILSAITSFFSMSDLGINNVSNNLFCINYAQNKMKECRSILATNYFLIILIGCSCIFLVFFTGFFIKFNTYLGLHIVDEKTAHYVLTLLICQVFLNMYSLVLDSIYNSQSLASKATYLNNTAKFLISIFILIGIICKYSILIIAMLQLIPLIIIIIYKHLDTKKYFRESISCKDINIRELKEYIKPSLAFMAFPFGNLFIFQGFTILINHYFGATTLVTFNTTRTMVNFIRTMIQTITSAVKPEFSLAYGRSDFNFMRRIHKKTLKYCFCISIFIGLILISIGPLIYHIWTSGKISFNYGIMIPLVIAMILNSLWEASGITLTSTNNHICMGYLYLLSTIIALAIAYLFCSYLNLNITLIAICIAISDILMVYYTIRKAYKITLDNFL